MTVDKFAPEATALRAEFDARFADPRRAERGRFVWDYWNIPGQYTALRTPAWEYFSPRLYAAFHRRLVEWGRRTLGCHDVSPPWLSCYIDGCEQNWHGDLPHGPYAFVFSLTRWRQRQFVGGETLLLRDQVLDYWRGFTSVRSVEEPDVLRAIAPQFARLTVFDPRIPHAVRRVSGTHDPRHGRLVIHGWFVQPRPFVLGPLPVRALSARIDELSARLGQWADGVPLAGLLSFSFTVDRRGAVQRLRLASDTTRVAAEFEAKRRRLCRRIADEVAGWRFAPQRQPSSITLPLQFIAQA